MDSKASAGGRIFRIPFIFVAALFLIFEAGVLMILPWALAFRWAVQSGHGLSTFIHIVSFLILMAIALAFALWSGALDWER